MATIDLTESSADLLNPERGFYRGYDLHAAGDASAVRATGFTLAIAEVRLDAYRNAPIDDAFLTALSNGFARVRAAGIKVVLRFAYNASATADAPLSRIQQHLTQLTPLLQQNADVIAVMQAGFIGAWGEWHGSTNGLDNDTSRAAVLDAILAALPSTRQVAVRTPMYKEAYTGDLARVAHHNDCFLSSPDDYGTYDAPMADWESYIGADTQHVSMGGETCSIDPPRSDCPSAIAEMENNHWSYLNSEYNLSVLNSWATQGCDGEIRQRLGYRFVVDHVTHNQAVAPGGALYVKIDLRNVGFAAPFNRRPVELVLSNGNDRRVARLETRDARDWSPGEHSIDATVRIPADLAPGTYSIALRLPDETDALAADPRYAIRLANDGVWSDATGDNVIEPSLVIDASAPGEIDPSATEFAEII